MYVLQLSEFLPKILRLFGGGSASSAGSAALTQQQLVALPYQIFECQVCGMQMRPAKGRADKIFGRDSFRCTRCGMCSHIHTNTYMHTQSNQYPIGPPLIKVYIHT